MRLPAVDGSLQGQHAKELERMRGEWVSKSGNTVFALWNDNGQYKVTRTVKVRGRELTNTYAVRQTDGCLYIDTGFAVVLTYDGKTDRITLLPVENTKEVTNH